jgi:RNA polymerase sigma-70 factor, ECF subfamily
MLGKVDERRARTVAVETRTPTERDLVIAFKGGEHQAYSQIYERSLPVVQHICRRLLKNPDDAEEATQETMLRVLQGLPRFNGRYLLQAWVARIATNVCLDILRSKTRRPEQPHPLPESGELVATLHAIPEGDPCLEVERRIESDQVRTVLEGLPGNHRDALIMRAMSGLSHEEMAQRMDITPSQAKALIHRAKGTFRRAWNAKEPRTVGLLFPAFLWRIPLPRFVRRMLGLGTEVTAGGGSTASTAPALAAAAPAGGERVAAAVAAVIVGTAGVGAVAATHLHPRQQRPQAVVAPAPAHTETVIDVSPAVVRKVRHHPLAAKTRLADPSPSPSVVVAPVSTPDPSPSPPVGSPSPSPSPSGVPTPSPSPTFGPEPGDVVMGMVTDVSTDARCGCGSEATISQSMSGTTYSFEVTDSAIADPSGDPLWGLTLDLRGDPQNLNGGFTLQAPSGPYMYTLHGTLGSRSTSTWGGTVYSYAGTYSFQSGPTEDYGSMPHYGTVQAAVSFNRAGTLVLRVALDLHETGN